MLSDWILYPSLKNSRSHPTLHDSPHTSWLTLHSMSLPRTPSFLPALKYGVLSYALHVSTLHSMSLPSTPSFRPALKYGVLSSALHASTLHTMSLPSTPSFRPALKYGVQNSILCVFAPHFMTHSAHHVSSPHWSAGFSSRTWGSLQAIRLECGRRVQVDFPELG
jgi:hypothetical protein